MTKAQLRALAWLQRHGSPASIDSYGRIIAADKARAPHLAATFLRLILSTHIEMCKGTGGLVITELGYARLMRAAKTDKALAQQLVFPARC